MPSWVLLALACSPSPTVELDDDVRTAAIVRWRSHEPGVGSVRYGPEGGSLDQETPAEAAPTVDHEVRVAGLRPGETWEFEAVVDGDAEAVVTLDVPPLADLPDLWASGDTEGDGLVLLHTVGAETDDYVVVVDRAGNAVFSVVGDPESTVLNATVSSDGRSVWFTSIPMGLTPTDSLVHHVAFDGSSNEVVALAGAHSAVAELPEGGFGFLRKQAMPFDEGTLLWDEVWERDADGTERLVFSLLDHFTPGPMCPDWELRSPLGPGVDGIWYDWTHANSLVLSPDGTTWYVGVRHFDAILGVDRASGALRFVLGGPFATIVPPEPDMAWQHPHFSVMDDERIFAFDNRVHMDPPVPLATEYEWDLASGSLTRVWSMAGPRDVPFLGDVKPTAEGLLVSWTSAGQVQEVSREGDVLWQLDVELGLGTGRVTPLDDLYGR